MIIILKRLRGDALHIRSTIKDHRLRLLKLLGKEVLTRPNLKRLNLFTQLILKNNMTFWRCSCNYKNNNSKVVCGKCEQPRPGMQPKEIPMAQRKVIRDYCPRCKKHTDFKHITKTQYSCQACHKKFKLIGPPIPEVTNTESQDAINLVNQIHVEQIKALKALE